MNISTIICTYIYETFVTIKAALEVTQAAADKILDLIYGIVKLALVSVREILNPVLRVIASSITSLMKSLGALWIRDFSDSKLCKDLFKCDFFTNYLLNPDSIFSKAVRGLFGLDGEDRYSRVQRELQLIVQDFKEFREQICAGVSLDLTLSAITGLFQDFLAQINKWLRWLRRKVDAVYKWLRYYLDSLKRWGVFDLLDQLQAMFDCILDATELCASVESAGSFYRSFTEKMKLYHSKANDWILKPSYERMCTSFMEGKIRELEYYASAIENGLKLFVNPTNVKPTTDCLNLTGHVVGIAKAVWTGDPMQIPVYKYAKTKIDAVIAAWNGYQGPKQEYNSFDDMLSDLHFERDGVYVRDIRLSIAADEEDELVMNMDETPDSDYMTSPIMIGDTLYSGAYAMSRFKTGSDEEIVNYFNEYNVGYTDLLNMEDLARVYA